MKYYISASNSRHEIEKYQLDDLYDKNILGEGRYSFEGNIYLHISDDSDEETQRIGLVRATFLDEELISNEDAGPLARIADIIDEDTSKAFRLLQQSNIFDLPCRLGMSMLPFHSCYMSTFIIDSEYRDLGFGTHVLKSLDRIYLHMFNTYIKCMVVYPKPAPPQGGWKDEKDKMQARKHLIRFFENNGFVALGDSGFYARNYASETR